ncbi:MAG: response regulator [Anaerolineae bacterium]|nr:response regulator [Anaerolineae bacterium]
MAKRILYIEDNPNDQRLVLKVLGSRGYDLDIAGDGETGLTLAAAHPPDLILVDMQMAGLNGMETARRLRQIDALALTPVVALTAYAEQYKRETYLNAGFTDYQQKQAGIKPLLDLVKRYLD